MIEGYFDPAGRPYVRAYVVVPGLQPALSLFRNFRPVIFTNIRPL